MLNDVEIFRTGLCPLATAEDGDKVHFKRLKRIIIDVCLAVIHSNVDLCSIQH